MSAIDELAAMVRAGLDAEAAIAQAATPGPWEAVVDDHGAGNVDASVWADPIGYYVTEKISSGERHAADGQHIARQDPAAVLRRVARDRRWLELLLAEPHHAWDDRDEYGCPRRNPELYERDPQCDCGRDVRVAAYLTLLAEPYQETT